MKIVKSTEVKGQLKALVREVIDEGKDIGIARGGVVARLTLQMPNSGYSAVQIKTEEARLGWSALLRVVTNNNARYYFKFAECPNVYLIREPDYEDSWLDNWRKHERDERAVRSESRREDVLDEVRQMMAEMQGHVTCIDVVARHVFEKMKQWETPPPHRTADDLERIERD